MVREEGRDHAPETIPRAEQGLLSAPVSRLMVDRWVLPARTQRRKSAGWGGGGFLADFAAEKKNCPRIWPGQA